MRNKMNIVFAGTPKFAADHLKILLNSEHKVTCILTQPDKASGRGKKVKFSPVKEIAIREGIEVLQPKSLLTFVKILKALENIKIDLMLVVAYGLLIPKKVLEVPKGFCQYTRVYSSELERSSSYRIFYMLRG